MPVSYAGAAGFASASVSAGATQSTAAGVGGVVTDGSTRFDSREDAALLRIERGRVQVNGRML